MKKILAAILIATCLSCLNLGDKKPAVAQTLEAGPLVRIPSLKFTTGNPIILSAHERVAVLQIAADHRHAEAMAQHAQSNQNTDRSSLRQNPLPEISLFLTDAYSWLQGS